MDEFGGFCYYLKFEFVNECKKWCLEVNRFGQLWGEYIVSGYLDYFFSFFELLLFLLFNVCKLEFKNLFEFELLQQ